MSLARGFSVTTRRLLIVGGMELTDGEIVLKIELYVQTVLVLHADILLIVLLFTPFQGANIYSLSQGGHASRDTRCTQCRVGLQPGCRPIAMIRACRCGTSLRLGSIHNSAGVVAVRRQGRIAAHDAHSGCACTLV